MYKVRQGVFETSSSSFDSYYERSETVEIKDDVFIAFNVINPNASYEAIHKIVTVIASEEVLKEFSKDLRKVINCRQFSIKSRFFDTISGVLTLKVDGYATLECDRWSSKLDCHGIEYNNSSAVQDKEKLALAFMNYVQGVFNNHGGKSVNVRDYIRITGISEHFVYG